MACSCTTLLKLYLHDCLEKKEEEVALYGIASMAMGMAMTLEFSDLCFIRVWEDLLLYYPSSSSPPSAHHLDNYSPLILKSLHA